MFQADSTALRLMAPWTHWAWARWEAEQHGDQGAAPQMPSVGLHVDVAVGSGLGGLVYLALQQAGDPRAELLGRGGSSILAANILRRTQFLALAKAWNHERVCWCLIKGGAFTAQFPEWLPHRHMTDLDIVVNPADARRATDALNALGYRRVDGTGALAGAWAAASTWQRREHTLLELDLHTRLHHPPLLADLEESVLASRVTADGLAWADPMWSVIVAAVHRARSGYRNSASELLDVAIWTRSWTPAHWRCLWEHAEVWTLQLPVIALLWACERWLKPVHIRQALTLLDHEGRYATTARAMAEGRWHSGRDGSHVVPMAKLYAPFAWGAWQAPGWRSLEAGARCGAAFVLHGVFRSADALVERVRRQG